MNSSSISLIEEKEETYEESSKSEDDTEMYLKE